MPCVFTASECKASGEKIPFAFNWTLQLARKWSPNTPYAAGVLVRPSTELLQTGYEYSSGGGQSNGKKEPKWPTTLGGTVTDGSITWTAVAISAGSLIEQISTSTWTVPPGLTGSNDASSISAGQQSTTIDLTGGAVGAIYTVVNEILTTDGHEYQAILELTIDA